MSGVGEDELRPEGELAGAGGEVGLKGVERWECGVGWETESVS